MLGAESLVTLEFAFALPAYSECLIQFGLNFTRIELRQQLACLHLLAGCDEHFFNAPADLGFDYRVKLWAHRAHNVFRSNVRFCRNRLHADIGHGWTWGR